ncbi:SAM-dependent methyltransferase [Sinorhizobium meliloti]|uniref:Uncharacterized protein n=1 Tax=Rhizobium meliloti TaxID=382 RepID=A0A6A7ZR71_RHIML|nr:hypothetical protein [Sinorhizobium meliloti]MQW05234.1 hypothetical protein [Sinorhizobium meliloti]QND35800.1 hypothetical protein HB772_29175 [Sinorhizobium meliloti]RVJ85398.1 hypothetical protein CN173_33300 [Sinorhizobium meliloti]
MFIIGIRAGDTEFVTIQAVGAMSQSMSSSSQQGIEKKEQARVRLETIERYVRDQPFRTGRTGAHC